MGSLAPYHIAYSDCDAGDDIICIGTVDRYCFSEP